MDHLGYKVFPKTADTIASRQAVQDRYSSIAQISQFVFMVTFLYFGLTILGSANASPDVRDRSETLPGKQIRSLREHDIRKARLLSFIWAVCIGVLCVTETAPGS